MPYVADHKGLWLKLPFPEVLETSFEREVWHLRSADWKSLQKTLGEMDWKNLRTGTAEDALVYFLEILWYCLVTYIPRQKIIITKRSHPWLNERSKEAIRRKSLAEAGAAFEQERARCTQVLAEEHAKYLKKH